MLKQTHAERREPRIARRHWAAIVLSAGFLGLAPFFLGNYPLSILTLGLAYGLFAFGLDLAWGRAGVISIGHAVFFGAGAYGVAIASSNGWHPLVGASAALLLTVVVSFILGRVGLGPKALPSTMAVITLALTFLGEQGARSWIDVTNGTTGIYVTSLGRIPGYYLTAGLVFVIVVAIWAIVLRGRFGRRLLSIRINQQRTEHFGVAPQNSKIAAFMLGAVVATLAGSIAAPVLGLVSPPVLGIIMSTQVLVWVAVGGKGTILGAFVGAILVTAGQLYLGEFIGSWYMLVLGVVFVLVVKFAPEGIVGLATSFIKLPVARRASAGMILNSAESDAGMAERAEAQPGHTDSAAIECVQVEKSFGLMPTIKGVDFVAEQGEIVCLIGPNGAGKTTLLNLIAGDLELTSGEIRLEGEDVTSQSAHLRARQGLGRLFQVPSIYSELTPAQNLELARSEAYRRVDLPSELDRFSQLDDVLARDLSLADQRALELAAAMAWGPRTVLLDEPAAGLSHEDASRLAALLKRLRDEMGCTLIVVEHDMDIVRELADRVVAMANGKIIADGTMDEVASHEEVRFAYLGAVS